ERRFPNWPGLNLTWEVREGIVKHETEYDVSDATDFNPELRGNLEAQIANVADELAYTTHDLDDGLRSGMIHHEMFSDLALWKLVIESVGWDGKGEMSEPMRHQIVRRLVGILISDVLEATNARIEAAGAQSVLDLQQLDHNVIGYSTTMLPMNKELKSFLFKNLYNHPRVRGMAEHARNALIT